MSGPHEVFEHVSPEFLKKRTASWSRTPAIVYDSIEGKLYRMPEDQVIGYSKAIMPGNSTKADIYLELDEKGDGGEEDREKMEKAQAWFARVDLGRLGWTARWKRHMGEIKYVYIKKGQQSEGMLQPVR